MQASGLLFSWFRTLIALNQLNRLKQRMIKLSQPLRTQLSQRSVHGVRLGTQFAYIDAATDGGERFQPLPHAQQHLHRATIIAPLDLKISDPNLQNAPVQLSPGRFIRHPCLFERIMTFIEFTFVEQFHPFPGQRSQWLRARLGDRRRVRHARMPLEQVGQLAKEFRARVGEGGAESFCLLEHFRLNMGAEGEKGETTGRRGGFEHGEPFLPGHGRIRQIENKQRRLPGGNLGEEPALTAVKPLPRRFPNLFLIGGSDIVEAMLASGELQSMIEAAMTGKSA